MANEKRRHLRLECEGTAKFFRKAGVQGSMAKVVDISPEGCQVVLEEAEEVSIGAFAEVSFTVRGLVFHVRGQVRTARSATVIGLQFDQVSERVRYQIEDLLEELSDETKKRNVNKEITGQGRITQDTIPLNLDLSAMGRPADH